MRSAAILANGKDIVAPRSFAKVIAFVDGRWMRVQRYIVVGRVVLITTTDGKLRSVPRSHVNLEAKRRKGRTASAENRPRSITDRPNGSSSTGDRFPLRSMLLGTHTDHKLRLPIKRSQLKFSSARQRMDPRKLKNLKELSEYLSGERNTLMQSSGTVPLLDKRLDGEVELGYSYIPGERQAELGGKKGAAAARLGLKGEWDRVKYWGEYGFSGKEFKNIRHPTLKDRAGGKIGAKLKLGVLSSKAELTRFHNNVQRDPTASRTIKSQGKVSFGLEVPQWPTLTLTYDRRGKETSRPNDTVRQEFSANTVSGKLRYSRSTWDAYVTSTHSYLQKRPARSDTIVYDYALGGSYRPIHGLQIKPFLKFTRHIYPSHDYRKETVYASLVSDYSIIERSMTLSLTGKFTADETTDGDYDTQRFDGSIGLVKNLSNVFGLPDDRAILSVKLNYGRYMDLVYQGADLEKYSVLFLFEISS